MLRHIEFTCDCKSISLVMDEESTFFLWNSSCLQNDSLSCLVGIHEFLSNLICIFILYLKMRLIWFHFAYKWRKIRTIIERFKTCITLASISSLDKVVKSTSLMLIHCLWMLRDDIINWLLQGKTGHNWGIDVSRCGNMGIVAVSPCGISPRCHWYVNIVELDVSARDSLAAV